MGRPATGRVEARNNKNGITYTARFTALGRRWKIRLGDSTDGMTAGSADLELQAILADVRRGRWLPAQSENAPTPVEATQTFHELASAWLEGRRRDLSVNGYNDYHWQLTNHLLPFFHRHYPIEITAAEVDRLRGHLLDSELSPTSVNKCIRLLAQILDVAEDYGLTNGNPARNRRRYARRAPKAPIWLDRPEQIQAILDAAAILDQVSTRRTQGRDAFIGTLVLAGLRISEACELRWRSVDFHNDLIRVEQVGKTAASFREVDMFAALRERLEVLRGAPQKPNDRVFLRSNGTPRNRHNARQRVVIPVLAQADELLVARGQSPLPVGVTAHKLRHTFASLLIAIGYDPATVQEQLGHTDARFTLNVYTHQMRRGPSDREALAALLKGPGEAGV